MKLIVDSNQLQSDVLSRYLSKSKSNVAVLTDYAAMEAYKGDTLASIYKSMAILSGFPNQVIVLKSTRIVCGLRGKRAGLQRRLIDEAQTKGFPAYVTHLRQAQRGNRHLEQQLLNLGTEATAHLNRMLADAQTTGSTIDDIAKLYSKEERTAIRSGHDYPSALVDKIVKHVMHIAGQLFQQHPNANVLPTYAELPNTYIFRVALCIYLLALEWGANGGAGDANPTKLRNDFVDMSIAAYATYFDGLLSADAKILRTHGKARVWLMALFDCELPGRFGYGNT